MSNNKFAKNLTLSNSQIKEARANIIAEDAKAAHEELLRMLKQEQRDLERRKLALSDLYPDSELSLRIAQPNFNAKTWVKDLQDIGVSLANKSVEIKIAQDTFDEWFSDDTSVTPPSPTSGVTEAPTVSA